MENLFAFIHSPREFFKNLSNPYIWIPIEYISEKRHQHSKINVSMLNALEITSKTCKVPKMGFDGSSPIDRISKTRPRYVPPEGK